MKRLSPLAALMLLIAAMLPALAAEPQKFRDVDVAGFESLRAAKDTVVLDVRTEKEFKAGHMPSAVLIDVNAGGFKEKVAALDKSKTYLVHCAAGVRSVKACNLMAELGFTNLVNLKGGYRAWEKAGHAGEH